MVGGLVSGAGEGVSADERVAYLTRVFGLSEAAALDTIDLLTNDDRIEEITTGMEATIERLVAMKDAEQYTLDNPPPWINRHRHE